MCRTAGYALAAVFTLAVIDACEVVFNRDSTERAGLFALFTADTAVLAGCTGVFADILRGAENVDAVCYIVDNDKLIRASLCAKSAAAALGAVDLRNAVYDRDSVVSTFTDTVAVAEAAVSAGALTVVEALCSLTGLNAVKFKFVCRTCIAVAVTADNCDLRNGFHCGNAHNFRNLFGNLAAAGVTEVRCNAVFNDSFGISRAARETA